MVSEKIKELRKQSKLSQEALAEKLCVSRQAVTKWETGAGVPDVDNLISLSEIFHVSLDELVGTSSYGAANDSEKKYLYESIMEYDIDCVKNFDITFMGADNVYLHAEECEKVIVTLLSDTINNIQKVFKTKIDDVKKKIDIDVKRIDGISETDAKAALVIDVMVPASYLGKVEIAGNTNVFKICDVENENIEFTGKVKKLFMQNTNSHVECNSNDDMEIFVKNSQGALDVNQLSATSVLYIYEENEFAVVTKGIMNKVIMEKELIGKKELTDDPMLVIELNGMKSELTIDSFLDN